MVYLWLDGWSCRFKVLKRRCTSGYGLVRYWYIFRKKSMHIFIDPTKPQ